MEFTQEEMEIIDRELAKADEDIKNGFKRTVEILTESLKDGQEVEDLLVYPIVYNARHSIELSLKIVIKMLWEIEKKKGINYSDEILTERKKKLHTHNIEELYKTACDNKDIDKKIFYIKNSYTNEIIDNELRGLDYTKDNMLSDILGVLERSINISDVGVIELAKICKDIFDKYTPNYDIRINNLFLLDSDESKEHFIVISYDNSFYSYNYNKQCFIKISYDVITKNIKDNKIGIYKGEDFYCKESRLVL